MIKLSKIAAAAVLALSFGVAHALPVIDDFTADQVRVEDSTTGNGGVFATQVFNAAILGGFRDVFVEKDVRVNDPARAVAALTSTGEFSYSENSLTAGVGVIRWDGVATGGAVDSDGLATAGVGIDLTAFGSAFEVLVVAADDRSPLIFSVYSGPSFTRKDFGLFTASTATPTTYLFNFANFEGADFTNVGAIELRTNDGSGTALDTTLDMVRVVPEPGTLALAGIALLGLGAIRRRKS